MCLREYKTDSIRLSKIFGETEILEIVLLGGGRTSFYCDNYGRKFWLRIVTNGYEEEPFLEGYCPGGLYVNEQLISVNSEEEKLFVNLLKVIKVPKELYSNYFETVNNDEGKLTEELIAYLIDFIESQKYTELAIKTGRL